MSRLRDHRVRMNGSACPDPAGCARLYHGALTSGLAVGDTCECCGQTVEPAAEPAAEPRQERVQTNARP